MLAELDGKSSTLQSSFLTARLALPFSGGAETFTFNVSPNQPLISVRDPPGITLTLILTLAPVSKAPFLLFTVCTQQHLMSL